MPAVDGAHTLSRIEDNTERLNEVTGSGMSV
jgi:hypothetical protein